MYQYSHHPRSNYPKPPEKSENNSFYDNKSINKKNQIESTRYIDKHYPLRESNFPQNNFKDLDYNQSNSKSTRQIQLNQNYINQFKSQRVNADRAGVGRAGQVVSCFRSNNTNVSKQDQLLKKLELYEQKYQVDTKGKYYGSDLKFSERPENKSFQNQSYRKKYQEKPMYETYERDIQKIKFSENNNNYGRIQIQSELTSNSEWQRTKTKNPRQYFKQNTSSVNPYQYNNYRKSNEFQKRNPDPFISQLQKKYKKDQPKIQQVNQYSNRKFNRYDSSQRCLIREQTKPNKQIISKQSQIDRFYAQRNQRKESLKKRSEQLKLKMNSPSPLKKDNQLSGIKSQKNIQDIQSRADRITNIEKPDFTDKQDKNQKLGGDYQRQINCPTDRPQRNERIQQNPDKERALTDRYEKIDRYDRLQLSTQRPQKYIQRVERIQRTQKLPVTQKREQPSKNYNIEKVQKQQRIFTKLQNTEKMQQTSQRQYLPKRQQQRTYTYKQDEKTQEQNVKKLQNKNGEQEWKKTPMKINIKEELKYMSSKKMEVNNRKPQLEQQTYRKIETINQLNNKINERIKHILSNFNQQI